MSRGVCEVGVEPLPKNKEKENAPKKRTMSTSLYRREGLRGVRVDRDNKQPAVVRVKSRPRLRLRDRKVGADQRRAWGRWGGPNRKHQLEYKP